MTTSLRFSTITLPSEIFALGVTIVGVAITPIFAVWAIYRYKHRPNRLFFYLCVCVFFAYIIQIIRLIGSNVGQEYMTISLLVSNNIYYPNGLVYMLIQTEVMRLFLLDHLKKFVWQTQAAMVFLYITCTPPLWVYGALFDEFGQQGNFWSMYSYFGLAYLFLVILFDMVQNVYALYYLAKIVIGMYTKHSRSSHLTDAIKRGIHLNQIILCVPITTIVLADMAIIILIMIPLPSTYTTAMRHRIQDAYVQIGCGLAPLHVIGGTVVLERMRDFKKIAERYRLTAIQKSVMDLPKVTKASQEIKQVARPTVEMCSTEFSPYEESLTSVSNPTEYDMQQENAVALQPEVRHTQLAPSEGDLMDKIAGENAEAI
ncbi:hypothetical protein BATDEDRAFT_24591 [Batrachochytrium dendrobatidis JAM81]|uniref:Uncharacterized protein n=2 Tax=Batrachochytrium dendrobatidis TaxID=109871 RepID=F4P155_BATDJ|nr:uncharacterized protein BATDEDRAFT_24591 [Batrachochytrium dendrobatidis JAM81]EGF80734.1 hypothetical protein BATDEDRAFT_24591 [Batrachochytrium dendrobatidis JAM81]OAJ41811.1 hypothetical protein BDEG_25353 [Batrachochytrium dendrobatidis JEL423]|eukprot:XP_006678492.1 hypothetical protein BATDEDRAFT_24591 [Batrachochytrium dendrobatidis JAM81]